MLDPIVINRLVDTAPEDLRAKQAELELRILDELDDWGSARLYVLAGSVNATAYHVNRALQHLRQAGLVVQRRCPRGRKFWRRV